MDGYRAAADFLTVIPALYPRHFRSLPPPVIPAKAGSQNGGGRLRRARAFAMIWAIVAANAVSPPVSQASGE